MSEAANELVDFLEGAASSLVTVNHERTVFFIRKGKGMYLYSTVSSPLDHSKPFTFHTLADLLIPAPTQLLWEPF